MANTEEQARPPPVRGQIFWCGLYASGVIGMLVVYGLLQERIMQHPYNGEVFKYSVFLVFLNRLAAVIFAVFMARSKGEKLGNSAELWKYLIVSLSNVFASSCQYEALKYVSFAVQMLGKSFKMMPVMIWGLVISGKKYTFTDWLVAAAVTGGVTEFLLTGPTAASSTSGNSTKGLLLLAGFLVLDGLTSTMQEKLFRENKTTKYNQMMYVNGISCLVSLGTLIISGHLGPALQFYFSHGSFFWGATVLSASAVGGQFFIYSMVKEFGALVFAATMNVRQVVSIIVSYMTYHHFITLSQVAGLAAVFGALFYKSVVGLTAPREAERPLMGWSRPAEKSESDEQMPAPQVDKYGATGGFKV